MIAKYYYLSKTKVGNCMSIWWGCSIRWRKLIDVWFYLFDNRLGTSKPRKGFIREEIVPP